MVEELTRDTQVPLSGEDTEQKIYIGNLFEDGHFQLEQSQEERFQHLFQELLAQCNGEVLQPELMKTSLRFEVRNDLLHRIEQGKSEGEKIVQLLVPQQ